jgi:hypothetical protein
MIELPDDELDKLFRKSSEELDPKYDPLDWNELKKRLDEEDGIKGGRGINKWLPLVLLLLFLTGGITTFYMLRNSGGEQIPSKVKSVGTRDMSRTDSQENSIIHNHTALANTTKPEHDKKRNASGLSDKSESLTKSKSEKILPRSRSKAGGVFLEPNRSSGKGGEGAFSSIEKKEEVDRGKKVKAGIENLFSNPAEPRDKLEIPVKVEKTLLQSRAEDKHVADDGRKSNAGGVGEKEFDAANPEKYGQKVLWANDMENNAAGADRPTLSAMRVNTLTHRPFLNKILLPLPRIVGAEPEKPVAAEAITEVDGTSPKIAFRFGYAPDLSAVGIKNFSKPGASVSILGEYGILKRLYLQTGVIWSSKVYGAKPGDYQLPKTHYYGPPPRHVEGMCKVFEIPLNFRYDIAQGKLSRIFAGAGVSSYHMNYEKYKYYFENEDDPKIGNYRGWHGATGWYFLSHINASVGYEYHISKKLSLLGEPYVRIPVRRVGYGKVNLFTTGIWLSIRYTPRFR